MRNRAEIEKQSKARWFPAATWRRLMIEVMLDVRDLLVQLSKDSEGSR